MVTTEIKAFAYLINLSVFCIRKLVFDTYTICNTQYTNIALDFVEIRVIST